jgi:hypothetical protein
MFCSGASLLYTAVVVPAQIFLWDYNEPCNTFPTLTFDVAVDSFFLVPCSVMDFSNIRNYTTQAAELVA